MPPLPLLSLVGNTPLVELEKLSPKPGVRLFAKLEGQNPSGSVKDRIVKAIVEKAEREGRLKPGDTLIDASSGNTAIALAMLSKQKGYNARVVIPQGVPPSIVDLLRLFGAEVTWCDSHAGMKGAVDEAQRQADTYGYYALSQFTDEENIQAHYGGTGCEIAEALPKVDAFIAGIGTGGTIMGAGRRLREANPNVRVIGVEPRLGERLQGLRSLSEGFASPLLDIGQLDGRFLVDSASALKMVRTVVGTEGIVAGVSSGACLSAALRVADRMERGNIVMMFSDGGWKYLPSRPWDATEEDATALDETHWW
jgi:cysteine synthase B